MSTKYLDYTGLAYFWSKLKTYLATTSHSGLMSATDKTKVDMITTDGTIAFYRKEESVYVTETTNEDTIPIGISGFTTADMLLVDINGLDLSEGEEYEISGTNIVLDTPIGTVGTSVHFVALRAVTATVSDYDALKGDDGVVQDVLQNGVSVLGQDGIARIVAQTDVGTATPTANTTAKFDSSAKMNSTDMSSADITTFVEGLNVGKTGFLDLFYPIGSYYETSDSTFNPNVTWGGTWILETEGQVHVSGSVNGTYQINGAPTDTNDGGSKDAVVVSHLHNVRIDATNQSGWSGRVRGSGNLLTSASYTWTSSGYVLEANPTTNTGVSGTNKNMPPYIVVNRWHRTA